MSAVLVTDPQLRIIRVNQAFCALSGFDTAELVGRRPPYPFWTEPQASRARQRMRETTEENGDFQLTVRRRDGRLIDAAVSVTPVRDSDGELIAYVATYEDLSAVRAQAQLERALRDVAAAAARNDPQAVFDQGRRRAPTSAACRSS